MPPKSQPQPQNTPALSLLARAHSPSTAHDIHTRKITTRPLHLTPTLQPSNAQTQRRLAHLRKAALRKKALRPKPLSSRQRRALGLYDMAGIGGGGEKERYAVFSGLHRLWVGYISEVLGEAVMMGRSRVGDGERAKLCSADYHGAFVEVVRSRCVSRVGLRGIVRRDSKFTFELVVEGGGRGKGKVIPKEGTVFRFVVPRGGREDKQAEEIEGDKPTQVDAVEKQEGLKDLVFELHGDQFIFRAADRATRKFKPKFLKDI